MKKFVILSIVCLLALPIFAAEPSVKVMNAKDISRAYIDGKIGADLIERGVHVDQLGEVHIRYDQLYRGLRVFEGQLITHIDAAGLKVQRVTNALHQTKGLDLDVVPRCAQANAISKAFDRTGAGNDAERNTELMVFVSRDKGTFHLAWRINVVDLSVPVDWVTFIDAHDGAMLMSYDNLRTKRPEPPPDDGDPAVGTGYSLYSGTVTIGTEVYPDGTYGMKDHTRGKIYTIDMLDRKNGGVLLTDADNYWGDFTEADRATVAVDAHFGAAITWNYYLSVHARNGVYDDGVGVYSRVHYGRDYNNAFWSDSCKCMTYGDGDGSLMGPLTAIDVAAHEMTHGVTSATADLTYSGESGGLNESMSDIFATAVEFYAVPYSSGFPDYWIGEDLWTPGNPGDALRYMDDPTRDGASIDHYSQFTPTMDVHYSSGLANHVFYLLCEGGTNATSGMSVPQIGLAKAERIFYRALAVYMTSGTTFAGAKADTVQAATDLYGATTAADVATAWEACGVQ
jgi:Zn-dependent metalloprotease